MQLSDRHEALGIPFVFFTLNNPGVAGYQPQASYGGFLNAQINSDLRNLINALIQMCITIGLKRQDLKLNNISQNELNKVVNVPTELRNEQVVNLLGMLISCIDPFCIQLDIVNIFSATMGQLLFDLYQTNQDCAKVYEAQIAKILGVSLRVNLYNLLGLSDKIRIDAAEEVTLTVDIDPLKQVSTDTSWIGDKMNDKMSQMHDTNNGNNDTNNHNDNNDNNETNNHNVSAGHNNAHNHNISDGDNQNTNNIDIDMAGFLSGNHGASNDNSSVFNIQNNNISDEYNQDDQNIGGFSFRQLNFENDVEDQNETLDPIFDI